VGVQDFDGVLQVLDSLVVDVTVDNGPSEGSSEHDHAGSPDVGLGEVDPLVDLSNLEAADTGQLGVWVLSGKESGDGGGLEDGALVCLETGELAGETLLLVLLGLLLLLSHDHFLHLDVGEVSGDDGHIGEDVSGMVVVDFEG